MKAVMYHYVREYDSRFPFFKNLHADDFITQLDFFESEFGFVPYEEFCDSLKTGKVPRGVVLSFDDGLKDHYTHVLPALLDRGLWGIFYLPTMVYRDNHFLDVHRIHLLLGQSSGEEIYAKLSKILTGPMLTHQHIKEFREFTYTEQFNDDYTKLVKRTLNYYIGYQYRQNVLDELMNHFLPDEDKIFTSFYLNESEIKILHNEGMVIGSHSVSHPIMSKLSLQEQKFEIEASFNFLEGLLGGLRIKTFCYPYGGFHSFTNETESLLEQNKCAFSFNVESREINRYDLLHRSQALPRYDCNQLPFGGCREVNPGALKAERN